MYSNMILDSKLKFSGLKFFDTIKIPFQCEISANSTMSKTLIPVLSSLVVRKEARGCLNVR